MIDSLLLDLLEEVEDFPFKHLVFCLLNWRWKVVIQDYNIVHRLLFVYLLCGLVHDLGSMLCLAGGFVLVV